MGEGWGKEGWEEKGWKVISGDVKGVWRTDRRVEGGKVGLKGGGGI